jgi:hypothetical protein
MASPQKNALNCPNARLGVTCVLALMLAAQTGAPAAPENPLAHPSLETRVTNEGGRPINPDGVTGCAVAKSDATEGVHLYDTGASALSGETVSTRAGWKEVGAGEIKRSFKGAACVSNDYLALVLRKESRGPECYYRLGAQMIKGPTLVAVGGGGERSKTITAFKVIENKTAGVVVEANAMAESGRKIATRYLIRPNQPIVEVQPGDGTESILVEAPGRYAVLPDVFAGDLVVSAGDAAAPALRFPSERMLLQPLDGGNAIVECAWPSSEQPVRLYLENHTFVGSEIGCSKAKGQKVAMAMLAAPAIWHEQIMGELDPVKDRKLEWQVPFRALWRANYMRTDGYIDSWKCIIRTGKDSYESFGIILQKSRSVWTSARGWYGYPACIEGDACFLRKTLFENKPDIKYDDSRSALIYPFRALDGGLAGMFGAADVWCDALADTPRASLDEQLKVRSVPRDKWPATCDVTVDYEDIFSAGQEREKKAFVLERLDAMNNFVIGIRSRINEYLDWCRRTRAFCAQTKAEQPRLAALVDELDGYLAMLDQIYRERKLDERNPAAVHVLIEKVAALIDSNDENKGELAKQFGRDTRTIGGNQDDSIGEFRMFTKELRQRAGYRMVEAKDDAAFEFARAMRQRTLEVLQCAFVHEFANVE